MLERIGHYIGLGNRNGLGDRNGLGNRNVLGNRNGLEDCSGLVNRNGIGDRSGLGDHDSTCPSATSTTHRDARAHRARLNMLERIDPRGASVKTVEIARRLE